MNRGNHGDVPYAPSASLPSRSKAMRLRQTGTFSVFYCFNFLTQRHLRWILRAYARFSSLIGRLGSSTFRLSISAVSMSLTGARFSSDSALRPFQYGIRGRGGTIYYAALPSD